MNQIVATSSQYAVGTSIHFLNVAYFFQLLYNLFFLAQIPSFSSFSDFISSVWLFYTVLAYIFCLLCIGVIVFYTIRLHQVMEEDDKKYQTILKEKADAALEDSRWTYIKNLIESPQQSDWRQAIIEADIMLEETLHKHGYVGETIGDMLKTANIDHFHTLNDAWEAHKVRNEIAHRGSEFELTDHIAYRTIAHYENVFREFGEI
jgi:hypothetical protein